MLGACGTLEAAKAFSASHSREDHAHRHTTELLGHPYRHTTELQTKQQAKYTIESQQPVQSLREPVRQAPLAHTCGLLGDLDLGLCSSHSQLEQPREQVLKLRKSKAK
jgi:hypothetical protein